MVAAGLAKRAEIQIAYAIGQARPVGTYVETFGTETVDPARISAAIAEIFGETPMVVARELTKLHEEIVRGTAAELAARYAAERPKGEVTLVIAPAVEEGA